MIAQPHQTDVRPDVTVERIADRPAGSNEWTPVREVRPAPVERTTGLVQGRPPSGPDLFGPTVEKPSSGQRTTASGKPQSGPAPVRTVLLVLGGSTAGAGIAGHLTVVLSSKAPFEFLGWLIVAGGVLVAVVKLGRAVASRLPGSAR